MSSIIFIEKLLTHTHTHTLIEIFHTVPR